MSVILVFDTTAVQRQLLSHCTATGPSAANMAALAIHLTVLPCARPLLALVVTLNDPTELASAVSGENTPATAVGAAAAAIVYAVAIVV